MRNFVFIGSPGSGKGTHADLLGARLGILHISTGDLYRAEMSAQTPLGLAAKKLLGQGLLGTDGMTEELLRRRLALPDADGGFILDGFPRTMPQTGILEKILRERGQSLSAAVFLKIPDAAVIERLSGRLICTHCQRTYHVKYNPPQSAGACHECGGALHRRDDDQPEMARKRLLVFHAQTEPILEYYRREKLLVVADADAPVETVSRNIEAAVREFFQA
ncbi:MAG: nucleoside monophosphate kinase [Verrucomicrobiales bacterium]|jgi:adenylate kinase|nr:nucleoside monophosphate kinase [Verrucomicrobiales bacterium]